MPVIFQNVFRNYGPMELSDRAGLMGLANDPDARAGAAHSVFSNDGSLHLLQVRVMFGATCLMQFNTRAFCVFDEVSLDDIVVDGGSRTRSEPPAQFYPDTPGGYPQGIRTDLADFVAHDPVAIGPRTSPSRGNPIESDALEHIVADHALTRTGEGDAASFDSLYGVASNRVSQAKNNNSLAAATDAVRFNDIVITGDQYATLVSGCFPV